MNAALRAAVIVADPMAGWTKLENESSDPVYLLTRYVALLALVPAVFGFVGVCVIGRIAAGGVVVRVSLLDGLFGAMLGYAATLALTPLLAVAVAVLAPLFGARRDFGKSLELVAYSLTPVWLSGVFLLLPGLHFLMLTGFYGVYLLWLGLPVLLKSPAGKSASFTALIVLCAAAMIFAAGVARQTVFPGSGGI